MLPQRSVIQKCHYLLGKRSHIPRLVQQSGPARVQAVGEGVLGRDAEVHGEGTAAPGLGERHGKSLAVGGRVGGDPGGRAARTLHVDATEARAGLLARTVPDLVERGHTPAAIRHLMISAQYRTEPNFTFSGLEGSARAVQAPLPVVDIEEPAYDMEGLVREERGLVFAPEEDND